MGKNAISTVEIAQKQRHLYLLKKVQNNKSLTAKELKELQDYEEMADKQKTEVRSQKTKIEGRQRGPGGRFVKTSAERQATSDDFAALAAELKAVAALDSQLEEHFDIKKYPRIEAALEEAVSARVEEIIKQRFAKISHRDYRRITLIQLMEITNKGRRTIYFWIDRGLPREDDGSFWLPKVFEWLEKYTENKVMKRLPDRKMNPYQEGRVKQLRIDIAEREHRLLDRSSIMAGMIARHQNLINAFHHKAEELARDTIGQSQSKNMEMLGNFFDGVLRQQCSVPEQLKLPADIAEQFSELLRKLIIDK